VQWYRKAAEQGYALAQLALGVMYSQGGGVTRDYAEAYMWFSLAAAQNLAGAGPALDNLESRMTPDQIAAAQKLAREWKPVPVNAPL
jgi:uncharacterized protein